MMRRYAVGIGVAAAIAVTPASASPEASGSYLVQLQVPVLCTVTHSPGPVVSAGDGYQLGQLQEYCNAPHGYSIAVDYAPGSLKGTVISLGQDTVTLDGSGSSVVSHQPGPRIISRSLIATPGPAGFNTDRIAFHIVAA